MAYVRTLKIDYYMFSHSHCIQLLNNRSMPISNPDQLNFCLQCANQAERETLCVQEASRLDPANGAIWSQLGLSRMSQGDIADSLLAFKEAIRLQPSLREAHINMGFAMKEVGRQSRWQIMFGLGLYDIE